MYLEYLYPTHKLRVEAKTMFEYMPIYYVCLSSDNLQFLILIKFSLSIWNPDLDTLIIWMLVFSTKFLKIFDVVVRIFFKKDECTNAYH